MKRILAFFLLLLMAALVGACAPKPCTFTQEELCLERDGNTTEMSIFSEAEDLKAVMDQLSEKDFIDPKHITLIGESQGGMVSSLVAAERKDQVEKLILIYQALCIKDDWGTMYPTLEDMPDTVDF